jgi:hypothetical protein
MPLSPTRRRKCKEIVEKLLTYRTSSIFAEPVDPQLDNCPDYFEVIAHPMDLGQVLSNIEQNKYDSFHEFRADMELIWENAITYNGAESLIAMLAEQLHSWFEAIVKDMTDNEVGDWFRKLSHLKTAVESLEKLANPVVKKALEDAKPGAISGKHPKCNTAPAVYDFEPILDDPTECPSVSPHPEEKLPSRVARRPVSSPEYAEAKSKTPVRKPKQRRMSGMEIEELATMVNSLLDEEPIRHFLRIIEQNESQLDVTDELVVNFADLNTATLWKIQQYLDSLCH